MNEPVTSPPDIEETSNEEMYEATTETIKVTEKQPGQATTTQEEVGKLLGPVP